MMGSREIAEVVNKNHAEVCRDIRTMLAKLYGGAERDYIRKADLLYVTKQCVSCIHYDTANPNAWEYRLDYEHSECLVTGYDAVRRMAMIKHWQKLKKEAEQPQLVMVQPAPAIQVNEGIVQLARVIAEATASATMKAMAEVITLPSYPTETAAPAPVYARQPEGEYVPVSKAAWETGLSDSACRKLIGFFKVPVRSNGGLRGLLVNLPEMKKAAERLLRESTAPEGKRKRWAHPQFGNFTCCADLI
ncbi:TPA_asm: DNA-binding protein [Salmonella enterica subsp. diarizonae]|uniref:DNA-binding protein n=1 Tax=Salmonella diarizonae TaxID=59204 RepID=A0A6Y1UG43_SALDZ|nr:DNA-binding protein [Salmonella enterica subsp. diarizonae]HCM1918848.1 Rha family transcriptional regulator [Salmonella enterica subsp. salamae serovar 28:r:e,n,z15]